MKGHYIQYLRFDERHSFILTTDKHNTSSWTDIQLKDDLNPHVKMKRITKLTDLQLLTIDQHLRLLYSRLRLQQQTY